MRARRRSAWWKVRPVMRKPLLALALVTVCAFGWYWAKERKAYAATEYRLAVEKDARDGFGDAGRVTVGVLRDGTVTRNSEPWFVDEQMRERMATKTGVNTSAHITATLTVKNQDAGFYISAPTARVEIEVDTCYAGIKFVGPAANQQMHWQAYLGERSEMGWAQTEDIYIDMSSPEAITREFEFTASVQELWRTETTNYGSGRHGKPVYATERAEADAWQANPSATWSASFGSLSGNNSSPPIGAGGISLVFDQHKGANGANHVIYVDVSNITWDGVPVNFAPYHYQASTAPNAAGVYLSGKEGGIELSCRTGTLQRQVGHLRPFIVDWSEFYIRDREGQPEDRPLIGGPFQSSLIYPASMGWSADGNPSPLVTPTDYGQAVYPSVEQIRDIGTWIQTVGLVTGMDYRDPDFAKGDLITPPNMRFAITAASARAYGLDPDDLTIEHRVPGVDQSTCDANADVDWPGLAFKAAGAVGIYGPEPALDHTDWVGANGATSPDASGAFSVTGNDATLTLAIPSGYGAHCADIPNQNFPSGMPGAPQMTYYHRADVWRGYDGANDQQTPPQPYSIPAEGRYCWRGYPALGIWFMSPSSGLLTMTISGFRYGHNDPHLTDSSRQTDYSVAPVAFTRTYTTWIETGSVQAWIWLQLAEETIDPDLECVTYVVLSGFGLGDWVIEEPELIPDPIAIRRRVKAFEGPDYRHGGISAVDSPEYAYSLMDTTEDNHGHDNLAEETVRMFDYVEGAPPLSRDYTTAWTLADTATILHNVCEAWECSVNTTAYDAATLDGESPPNRLSTCWAFDVCHPDCHAPDIPLVQEVDTHLNCSIRCRTWTIARGITYCIRPDKVVGGAAHGIGYESLRRPSRDRDAFVQVWRKPNGAAASAWAKHGPELDVNEYAMYRSRHLEEFRAADGLRWDYGVGIVAANEVQRFWGAAPVREYIHRGLLTPRGGGIDMFRHPAGNVIWTIVVRGGEVQAYETRSGYTGIGPIRIIDASGQYDDVDGDSDGPIIYVDAHNIVTGEMSRWYSTDAGETWTGPTQLT